MTTTSPLIPNPPDQPADSSSAKWRLWLPLVAILLLAAALRIPGLGHDSLWGDETCTVMIARKDLPELIHTNIWWEQIPPFHHLVIHYWIKLFGDSETSVRLPSALAGIAGVWMLFVLTHRLIGRRAALAAMLLLAVSPMHIAFSQECRSYTLSVLLCLISTDIFIRMLRQPTQPRHRQRLHVAYVLVTAISLYTHLYGIFTVFAQHLFYLFELYRRRGELPLRPRQWITDNIAIVALFSPWVPIVVLWTKSVAMNFWVKKVTLDDISRSYWTYSGQTAVYVIMIALVVIGIARYRKTRPTGLAMLLLLMLCPVVVPDVISVLTRPSFAPRYGIMGCIGMCAVAGAGAAALPRMLRTIVLAALVILSPLGSAAVIPRAQWREIGDFMNKNMRPNDIAVIHCSAGIRLYNYYVHRPDVHAHPTDTYNFPFSGPLEGRRVWLVIYDPWHTANDFLAHYPMRIERRLYTWGVMVLELTDQPAPGASPTEDSITNPRPQPTTEPATKTD